MASRTAVTSALRSVVVANSTRPAVVRATSRALTAASTRTALLPSTGVVTPAARQWFSAGAQLAKQPPPKQQQQQQQQQQGEDLVPGSKRWEFEDIKKQLEETKDPNVVFVDVREPMELRETGIIPGAVNIPVTSAVQSFHVSDEDFEDMYGYARPAKDKTLVFYCKAGVRAKSAAGLALHAGWKSIGEYTGSWLDWAEKKGPVEKVKGGN